MLNNYLSVIITRQQHMTNYNLRNSYKFLNLTYKAGRCTVAFYYKIILSNITIIRQNLYREIEICLFISNFNWYVYSMLTH